MEFIKKNGLAICTEEEMHKQVWAQTAPPADKELSDSKRAARICQQTRSFLKKSGKNKPS